MCEPYPYDLSPPDTTFKVGRTFNLLAMILGASFIFMDILTGCASTNQKKSVRQSSGLGYIVVTLCSGLSLLILQVCTSSMHCSCRFRAHRSHHRISQYV